MPLLLGNHDKNIITATDVIETEPLSWSTKEIVIRLLGQKKSLVSFEVRSRERPMVEFSGGKTWPSS